MKVLRQCARPLDRRDFLTCCAAATLGIAVPPALKAAAALSATLSKSDDQWLDELERRTFRYFVECANEATGLVKDRSRADGPDPRAIASIAATGFGLTALCIGAERGWLRQSAAQQRVRAALRFLAEQMPHEHGWFYHFVHWRSGERQWKCELSTIDTALLLCGVLTCRAHFDQDREIRRLASAVFDRVEWDWMLQGGQTLLHGWTPERGFLTSRWSAYCEHMMLYLLAIGADQHAIPAEAWDAWRRPALEYDGIRYISDGAPLFVHQYSHAWFDFRARRDRHADYWQNSVNATRAHRQFCLDLKKEFPHFDETLWGITASDSAKGYIAWGGPPRHRAIDGTIVPCAAAGSLPFLPSECLRVLRTIRERFGGKTWQRYGFVDAFNPATGWTGPDVIGIDAGITLLMAENLRSGFVWRTFMKNEEARRGMERVHFRALSQP